MSNFNARQSGPAQAARPERRRGQGRGRALQHLPEPDVQAGRGREQGRPDDARQPAGRPGPAGRGSRDHARGGHGRAARLREGDPVDAQSAERADARWPSGSPWSGWAMSACRWRSAWRGRTARVVGFDIDAGRVAALAAGRRRDAASSGPTSWPGSTCDYTADAADLAGCTCFILTVPTPIDANRQPDLGAAAPRLRHGRRRRCAPGGLVVVREHRLSGRDRGGVRAAAGGGLGPAPGPDFQLGYSPERINPGDREHRLETIAQGGGGRRRGDAASGWRRSTARWSRRGCTGRRRSGSPRPPR